MTAWMLFAAGVGLLAAVAAHAAERALRLLRLPGRWAWAAGIALSISLPFVLPRPQAAVTTSLGEMEMTGSAASPVSSPAAAPSPAGVPLLARLDAAMPWAWGMATAAAAGALLVAAAGLARRRRGWAQASVGGERVLLSGDVGPAVVGFVRPRIVVPRWVLAWAEPLQRLMLRHEREHVRAGDPLLLLGGVLAAALLPWSPAVWWQLRRLRLAVEVDCDARTLRGGADVLAYGRLLLAVGRVAGAAPATLVAFSEPRSFLEQRITAMTSRIPRHRARRVAAWAALGALAAVAAAALPAPSRPHLPALPAALALEPDGPDTSRVLTLAEVDRQPALANRDEIFQTLQRAYPPRMRDAGVEGRVAMDLIIGADGRVRAAAVQSASRAEFREPALGAARRMRFRPAEKQGQPVPVHFDLRIAFQLAAPSAPAVAAAPVPGIAPVSAVDQPPALLNRGEVLRALQRAYPPLLRARHVQGQVKVQLVVGADGAVRDPRVLSASRDEFRQPALAAAARMRFRPARKDGRAVPVQLVLPVEFRLDGSAPR